jgi:hypothetical protein
MSVHEKLDDRDLRYLKFVFGRAQQNSDEDIIKELDDPDVDAPEVLYRQLAQDGLPVCRVCGATYVEEGHCEQVEKKRRGSAKGESVELPPAKEAASLFKEALDKLLEAVAFLQSDYESASSSRYSKEYLQGELFFRYTREEAHWADDLEGRTRYTHSSRAPGDLLTQLIAVYLLVFGDPKPLIEKLCLDPAKLDREKLRKQIEGEGGGKPGLFGRAENIAILIRGGHHIRQGPQPAGFSDEEQIIHRRSIEGRREGLSDEQISELLAEEAISASKADIRRLRRENLPDPSS